jgi:CMP-N-acetylneuraminic acid synthetase
MKVVALLPMKANSERVPGKNFKMIGGKPLFRWILDELLLVPQISQLVINTDARDLISIHSNEGDKRVTIRDRESAICGDLVSMNSIIGDDINAVPADVYLMTHTTNPLLTASTIEAALKSFNLARERGECDSLFSVNKVQTRFYDKRVKPVNHDPDNLVRTQDLDLWFEENSCIYIFTRQSFLSTKARIGNTPKYFITPKLESVDIDDSEDWEMAAALLNSRVAKR